jgi:hypothetical protein
VNVLGVINTIVKVYFHEIPPNILIFTISSETETGSAEGQPVRDSLMTDENVNQGRFHLPDIFRGPMP